MERHRAQEAPVANKDKGGGHAKKAPAKNLKQKRAAKKAKRAGKS
jgi:hypothetical protein